MISTGISSIGVGCVMISTGMSSIGANVGCVMISTGIPYSEREVVAQCLFAT